MEFSEVKDSGERQEFVGGAVRDRRDKIRYGLLPVEALRRVAQHYTNGAKKYAPNNWRKGMGNPEWLEECWESIFRHIFEYREGDRSEDHLSAIVFGVFNVIVDEEIHYASTPLGTVIIDPKDIMKELSEKLKNVKMEPSTAQVVEAKDNAKN